MTPSAKTPSAMTPSAAPANTQVARTQSLLREERPSGTNVGPLHLGLRPPPTPPTKWLASPRTAAKPRCPPTKTALNASGPCLETVQDMFLTPLHQQHASHTLASRAHVPQPHVRS